MARLFDSRIANGSSSSESLRDADRWIALID